MIVKLNWTERAIHKLRIIRWSPLQSLIIVMVKQNIMKKKNNAVWLVLAYDLVETDALTVYHQLNSILHVNYKENKFFVAEGM